MVQARDEHARGDEQCAEYEQQAGELEWEFGGERAEGGSGEHRQAGQAERSGGRRAGAAADQRDHAGTSGNARWFRRPSPERVRTRAEPGKGQGPQW